MNKKNFISFLNASLKGLPIEKQKLILDKIKNEWIPEYLQKKLENYTFCNVCHKYSLTKNNEIITKQENRMEITYTDAGYGDSDRYGEVQYQVDYQICPLCLNQKEKQKKYGRILWEKGRHDR